MAKEKEKKIEEGKMVQTRDGKTVASDAALALNYKGLQDRRDIVERQLSNTTDPGLRDAKDKFVRTAEIVMRELSDKGPVSYAFASLDSKEAQVFVDCFEKTDVSTPPANWRTKDGKPRGEVRNLFVSYPSAIKDWEEAMQNRHDRQAKRDKERDDLQRRREEDVRKSEEERNRHLVEMGSAADSVLSLVSKDVRKEVEREDEETKARKEASKQRIEKARNFFVKALCGDLIASPFFRKDWNGKVTGIFVSRDCPYSLAVLASLADQPHAEISSAVDGSIFKGRVSDYHTDRNERTYDDWMVATFSVKLVTKEGEEVKIPSGMRQPNGFVIMHNFEARTFKQVVKENAKKLGLPDPKGDEDAYRKEFYGRYHLQALSKAARWASDTLFGKRDDSPKDEEGDGEGVDQPNPTASTAPKKRTGKGGAGKEKRLKGSEKGGGRRGECYEGDDKEGGDEEETPPGSATDLRPTPAQTGETLAALITSSPEMEKDLRKELRGSGLHVSESIRKGISPK